MADETENRPLVLILEDEPLIADLYQTAVEEAGFAVIRFSSAEQALAWIGREDTHFVGLVTDINLGGRYRGWDVATRAREVSPSTAVVYCTGFDPAEWSSKGVPKSVVLTKPFVPAQLVVALVNQLNDAAVQDSG